MAVALKAIALHATCVAVGEAGVLIQGPSGSGKSQLARHLIEAGLRAGLFARLVCDDRVLVECRSGRLLARPHPAIAGRLEVRGLGIGATAHEQAVLLRLVVDLDPSAPRLPALEDEKAQIEGVLLPVIRIRQTQWDLVLIALGHAIVQR
jgi:HPr kinase/phosphorylase